MTGKVLTVAVIAFVAAGWLRAQDRAPAGSAPALTDKPYVRAVGQATLSVKPDRAVIEIGVVTQGSTVQGATAQNAQQTTAVMADLHRLLGAEAKIRTTNYSVRPNYQNPKPGASPSITGYTATNAVEVTLDDTAQVAGVVDAVTRSGANLIQSLEYRLRDPRTVRAQALREAAAQARANAEAIAAGLGLKAVRVLSAEEETNPGNLLMSRRAPIPMMSAAMAPPTPVEVGMIDVEASVTIRVEVAP